MTARTDTPLIGVCTRCGQLFDECHCEEGNRRRATWSKPTNDEDDPGRAFLRRFVAKRRAFVAPQFYAAVRSGITEPEEICKTVRESMARRLSTANDADTREKVSLLLDALTMWPDEALLFADHIVRREQLPASVQMQQKAARAAHYRREFYRKQGWGTPA